MNADDADDVRRRFASFSTYSTTPSEALELFDAARGKCPVPHSEQLGGFHLLLDHEDVRKGLIDWRRLSNGPAVLRPLAEGTPRFPPLDYDPPEHGQWRKIFTDGLNPTTPERIEALVQRDTVHLIEGFAGRGHCDLVEDLAEVVPMNALFHILGIEENMHEQVRTMTINLLASVGDPDTFRRLFEEFAAMGYAEVQARRDEPRDDYLTTLAQATMDGRPLTPAEIGATMNSLLVAGHGTTVAAMTNLFWEVLSRPEIRRSLIDDPALIPVAIEEALRMHTPFFGLYRMATEDLSIRDVEIRKGESVYMCWQAANRDPSHFEDPNDFRLDRAQNNHLTFGLGRHSCVGAPTARMQLRIVLTELLARLPDIHLTIEGDPPFVFMGAETCAIKSLPAEFTPI